MVAYRPSRRLGAVGYRPPGRNPEQEWISERSTANHDRIATGLTAHLRNLISPLHTAIANHHKSMPGRTQDTHTLGDPSPVGRLMIALNTEAGMNGHRRNPRFRQGEQVLLQETGIGDASTNLRRDRHRGSRTGSTYYGCHPIRPGKQR